jgi:hypothetical protein
LLEVDSTQVDEKKIPLSRCIFPQEFIRVHDFTTVGFLASNSPIGM